MNAGSTRAGAGALLALLAAQGALAGNRDCVYRYDSGLESSCRLEANEENFLAWQQVTGDEHAFRGKVSLRYWFSAKPDRNVYFKFNNEFDWYLETRDSGPVIGRTFNPGIVYRHSRHDGWFALPHAIDWIDFGAEHRSNGQTVDAVAEAAPAQAAEKTNHRFFDAISRSSNFVSLQVRTQVRDDDELFVKLKGAYRDREHRVTWGALANDSVNIEDYDRLNVRYVWKPRWEYLHAVDAELTLGDQGLNTRSLNLGVTATEIGGVPVYLRMHWGPMNTLSNYTKSQRTLGIGVVFRPWKE